MGALGHIHWDEPGRLDALLAKIDPSVALVLDKALNGGELDFVKALPWRALEGTSWKRSFSQPMKCAANGSAKS